MKEKPILFSGPMIRAILDDRKTQTRRVVKNQPKMGEHINLCHWVPSGWAYWHASGDCTCVDAKCPYQIGMNLWVRETYAIESNFCVAEIDLYKPPFDDGRPIKWNDSHEHGKYWDQCHYRATDPAPELCYEDKEEPGVRWRPSIFMPRWASRINLTVTDVRIERLQEISREDAKLEGFWPGLNGLESWDGKPYGNAQLAFQACWNDINGKKHPWDSNPWVWVIEFERKTH